jgi:hypothetical protein
MTAEEASSLMGLPLWQHAPAEFTTVSSTYYGSEESNGSFVVELQAAEGSIVVHQEAASGDAPATGAQQEHVTLSDGTPAVLIDGAWMTSGGVLTWTTGGEHSLIFERDGVRTVISAQGEAFSSAELVEFASAAP